MQPTLRQRIIVVHLNDSYLVEKRRLAEVWQDEEFSISSDGGLMFERRLCVPADITVKIELLTEAHSSPSSMHPSRLLKTLKGYTVIWVVVDRLTKLAYFISGKSIYATSHELVWTTNATIQKIRARMLTAQSRQKSYADERPTTTLSPSSLCYDLPFTPCLLCSTIIDRSLDSLIVFQSSQATVCPPSSVVDRFLGFVCVSRAERKRHSSRVDAKPHANPTHTLAKSSSSESSSMPDRMQVALSSTAEPPSRLPLSQVVYDFIVWESLAIAVELGYTNLQVRDSPTRPSN
ncbi:pol protein [Cucumis melo var. makuwa]|uniref:Pol protein n=1 Tax=Cucumis melo var. makuwa TaxID=1194695 RepID=A0A5A7TQ21_CUCMM|nr:pol protein [Cucumis melo var. makuwa]TYK19252.1 pol protein [Cucumis melo var. makuwa]